MKILQAVKKIPGGLMVVPLLLGAIVNTFFGDALQSASDGTFTIYLWKSGTMSILTALIFCNVITINLKKVDVTTYKSAVITAVKVRIGIIIGLICSALFGEKGFLGLSTLATVGALANSNGGLYAVLTGGRGDVIDIGAVSTLSINNGPLFTMIVLEAAGVAKIPMSTLVGCIVPVIVECILGNLDEDIRKFCEPGVTMLIPFFASPLGVGLNIMNLLKAGGSGILLGAACTLITGLGGYLVYKLLRMEYPEVGGAIGTIVGDAAAIPISVAAVDTTLLVVAEATTARITAAIIVTATLCSIFVSYLHKVEVRRRGR